MCNQDGLRIILAIILPFRCAFYGMFRISVFCVSLACHLADRVICIELFNKRLSFIMGCLVWLMALRARIQNSTPLYSKNLQFKIISTIYVVLV